MSIKICGVVVLFNPDKDVIKNIMSYIDFCDEIMLIDNSASNNSDLFRDILKENDAKYISFSENKGIAYALKIAFEYSIKMKFDYLLTMDQDSSFAFNDFDMLKRIISKYSNAAILCLNLFTNKYKNKKDVSEISSWITSGNIVNVSKYKKIEGINEELFIDYVDFDLDRQFIEKNEKIFLLNNFYIYHKIGNPKQYNIFGIKFTCMNHAPVRYYYRYRNSFYLYKKYKKYFKKKYYHELFIEFPKMILFEKNKYAKIKMIFKGRKDAKLGKMGIYV